MKVGDMIVYDKVLNRKVVSVETDGKFYTSLRMESGLCIEPMIEETENGPKAYLRMVIKHDPQKVGQVVRVSGKDPGAAGGDEEDSEGSEGASQ